MTNYNSGEATERGGENKNETSRYNKTQHRFKKDSLFAVESFLIGLVVNDCMFAASVSCGRVPTQ